MPVCRRRRTTGRCHDRHDRKPTWRRRRISRIQWSRGRLDEEFVTAVYEIAADSGAGQTHTWQLCSDSPTDTHRREGNSANRRRSDDQTACRIRRPRSAPRDRHSRSRIALMTSRQPICSLRECGFTRGGADAAPSAAVGDAFGHDPMTLPALSKCSSTALDKRLTIRIVKM